MSFALTLALAALLWPSLCNLYANPAYQRDDYRGIHALITASAPAAPVLFDAPNQWEVYTYYQRNSGGALVALPYKPENYAAIARPLELATAGQPLIFVLYFAEREADPEGWIEGWLNSNTAKLHEEWIGNIRLAVYDGAARYTLATREVALGRGITLARAEADLTQGSAVPLKLTWRAATKPDRRYKVFVHIGAPDAPPVAQSDGELSRPTDGWAAGEEILDTRGVWIKPGTPAGAYGVYVGLYEEATGERLGERVRIGEINVRQLKTLTVCIDGNKAGVVHSLCDSGPISQVAATDI